MLLSNEKKSCVPIKRHTHTYIHNSYMYMYIPTLRNMYIYILNTENNSDRCGGFRGSSFLGVPFNNSEVRII